MPYFLGAIQEDKLKNIQELRLAKRELKIAESNYEQSMVSSDASLLRAKSLIVEAQQAEIIPQEAIVENKEQILKLLQDTLNWKPSFDFRAEPDRITILMNELSNLRLSFQEIQSKIDAAEAFAKEEKGYSGEIVEQELRLESIELFNSNNGETDFCPLCSSKLVNSIPSVSAIKSSLLTLQKNLEMVNSEKPRLREYISNLKITLEELRQQIGEKEFNIIVLKNELFESQKLRDRNARAGRTIGRISLFLESQVSDPGVDQIRLIFENAQNKFQKISEKTESEKEEEALTSLLNIIGQDMSSWAKELQLEHSEFPYRFDINKLTVINDRPGKPIPMSQIGGGENHLGFHLITLFALHKYFINQKRPVPGFIFLDQPSQVYFPSDVYKQLDGRIIDNADVDRKSVLRLFNFILRICNELTPEYQIIITEHANLNTAEYQAALIEEPWLEGEALIPKTWIN